MYAGDVSTVLANLAGLGAISLPGGVGEDDLPCGIQFIAPALKDERLASLSAALEAASGEAFAPLAPFR